jgi:PAS domain-containing protein
MRALILAPTLRDAQVTRGLLDSAGLAAIACPAMGALIEEMKTGAGAILFTDEVLHDPDIADFLEILRRQPSWSDLPVVMMMRGGTDSPAAARVLNALRNVTLLERPAPMRSVQSAVQAAIRARARQYQMRDHIEELRAAQREARELQHQLEMALNASALGTFHCEMPLGRIIWNDRCKEHFFLPHDAEVDFDLFYSLLHPDDRERTRAAVNSCVYDGKPYDIEYRAVSPAGEIRRVRANGRT